MRSHASATIVLTRRSKQFRLGHAEAFEALEHLFVLSSKAHCEADHAEVAEWTFLPHLTH
jgi:hypothetical protein